MPSRFVIVSGLPGSGKTTLARALAQLLHVPLLDKDDVLEELFAERGIGDAAWRRQLSRDSDAKLEVRARAADRGAVIVSFWHVDGMAADSGTPTTWLSSLHGTKVHVRCLCATDVAARRFRSRPRHAGHLDAERLEAELIADFDKLAACPPLAVAPVLDVDTSGAVDVHALARQILRQP
jgi:hypothetical protein